eukprot:8936837-Alexandrium_andersonii.AAC.1
MVGHGGFQRPRPNFLRLAFCSGALVRPQDRVSTHPVHAILRCLKRRRARALARAPSVSARVCC